jgi:hypothetical protein
MQQKQLITRKSESCEIDGGFHAAYQELQGRMKALAEAEGHVFPPNPEPLGPVNYVLICMEPSLGRWARTYDEARAQVEAGFRNFLASIETAILHFCARRYLCDSHRRYYITDISKGAMLVNSADVGRRQRYDRWYPLLLEELDLCATANAGVIAVGNIVFQYLNEKGFQHYLKEKGFQTPLAHVIHYSSQAGLARRRGVEGLEDAFDAFRGSVCLEDILATLETVLNEAHVPSEIRNKVFNQLPTDQLTTSLQQLIFNYKIAFERFISPPR